MPTYEYECKKCSHNFEVFQSINDEPLKVCPNCGKEVRRLIFGGAGVIFKGSGFYVTDKNNSSSRSKAGKTPDSGAKDGQKAAETATAPKNDGQKAGAAHTEAETKKADSPSKSEKKTA